MDKTIRALDDLVSTTIGLIPAWMSMLKSTRVLALIGTLVLIYITLHYGGLTENQMMVVTAIEAATGISFTGFKTLRPSQISSSSGAVATASPVSPSPAQLTPIASVITYNEPIDIDEQVKSQGGSNYERYDYVQQVIKRYNLLGIHPDIRVEVAEQVINKAIDLAIEVWPELVGTGSDGKTYYRAPEKTDYKDYATRQLYEKQVRDSIPGCQYTPEGAKILIDDLAELYKFRSNLTLLEGKPIRWYEENGKTPRVSTIYTLASLGLAAVA